VNVGALVAGTLLSILWIVLAAQDVRTQRISNVGTMSALALALGYRLGSGVDGGYALALGAGIVLALGIWSTGVLGGGDAKLLVSVLAWSPTWETWIVVLVCLAAIGSAMAVGARLKRHTERRHPLGIAISAAGLVAMWLL
jgi:Flp pilus assembly protein protease CpaA